MHVFIWGGKKKARDSTAECYAGMNMLRVVSCLCQFVPIVTVLASTEALFTHREDIVCIIEMGLMFF